MPDAVDEYRRRRQQRLDARFRRDAPEEENNSEKPSGGHGNTRLPFGLCHRYGIEIGKDWQPRDAWDALAEKGITPASEFAKRSEKNVLRTSIGSTYRNLTSRKEADGRYSLRGDRTFEWSPGKITRDTNAIFHQFLTKEEMFACLQEQGVTKFKDPDTGETVNPAKMKLPKTVAKIDETRYTDIVIGMRRNKSGRPFERRGFTVVGKDFTGKKNTLKVFDTIAEAKKYTKKIGCSEEDLRLTPFLKEYASATIR